MKIKDLADNLNRRIEEDIIDIPNNNYYDSQGVPQPRLDGEPQEDYVYDYYIDRNIEPPWFEELKAKQQYYEDMGLSRAKDITAYLIRKHIRQKGGSIDDAPFNYNAHF